MKLPWMATRMLALEAPPLRQNGRLKPPIYVARVRGQIILSSSFQRLGMPRTTIEA